MSYRTDAGSYTRTHLSIAGKPSDYPLSPFKMKFDPPLFHPNSKKMTILYYIWLISFAVYADGNVCISILHTPGDDPTMYEQASERWSPVQSVEKVILSVISMLAGMSKDATRSVQLVDAEAISFQNRTLRAERTLIAANSIVTIER